MSDKEQVLVQMRLVSDGTIIAHAHERFTVNLQAKYAYTFLPAVLASEQLRQAIVEDDSQVPSPRKIASYACDLAQQLLNQFEERDWIVPLPDPVLAPEEVALVSERLAAQGAR